jgi:hypothetical protein
MSLCKRRCGLCFPSEDKDCEGGNYSTQLRDSSYIVDNHFNTNFSSHLHERKKRRVSPIFDVNGDTLLVSSKDVRKYPSPDEQCAIFVDSDDDVSIDNNDYV